MEVENIINITYLNDLNVNDAEFLYECVKTAEGIKNGNITIVKLVEELESLLTDKNPEKRQKGTYILSNVLDALPRHYLLENQLNFISMFYVDRLKDHHEVIPAVIRGILALIEYNLPEGSVTKLFSSLFQNVSCQQQQHNDRFNIYKIFKTCWDKYRKELQIMSFDFIYGIISFMDGERDPRNLMSLFGWLPHFLKDIQLGHLTEEMFEVMACYFPVDFKPYNQEEKNITRDDLATALLPCLIAIPEFSENCITLALDNLAASPKTAKLDALKLLEEGCSTFSEDVYLRHSQILTDIQREVLTTKDAEIESASLSALTKIMTALSKCPPSTFKITTQNIIDSMIGNVIPDSKLFEPSIKILLTLIKASKMSSNMMIPQIVPLLSNTFRLTKVPSQQMIILFKLTQISVLHLETFGSNEPELQTVPVLCLNGAKSDTKEVRSAAFNCLAALARFLPDETKTFLYTNLCLLLIEETSPEEFDAIVACFKALAENYPEEVEKNVFNCIEIKSINELCKYFVILATIGHISYFFSFVIRTLSDACFGNLDQSCKINENNIIDASKLALEMLGNFLILRNNIEDCRILYEHDFLKRIVNWCLNNQILIDVDRNWNYCENLITILNKIIEFTNQEDVNKELDKIIINFKSTKNVGVIVLINGLICRSKGKIDISEDVIDTVLEICLISTNVNAHEVAVKLMGNIVNKMTEEIILEKVLKKIDYECQNAQQQNVHFDNSIHLIAFVAKGLIMKDHKEGELWINKLINLLKNHEEAVKGFKFIMNDNYYQFNADSYVVKKLLYRQKFFVNASKILNELYKDSNVNYLLAFGYLIGETPQSALKLEFKKIIKFIVLCLDVLVNPDVLLAVLNTLSQLVEMKDPLAEEYMQEFIERFLKLSKFTLSMKVRIKALQSLKCYANGYPIYRLLPLKKRVLFGLIEALDDKKRLVRKEAVETRSKWFLIDAPE